MAKGFPCDNLYNYIKRVGMSYQVSHVIVVLRLADYGGTEAGYRSRVSCSVQLKHSFNLLENRFHHELFSPRIYI